MRNYILIVYDVKEKRVNKILKICRQFLDWVQNSVHVGELTKAVFEKLKVKLTKVTNKEEDSIRISKIRTGKMLRLEILGIHKKQVLDNGII
ncbi:CRISPR-associated protein Cas2 [Kosmotoga olearia TBF 19.5.1]|uniref:CRISPR-associated endoribonuclease Cas2 n=1 Tax=Kosmotoga olearia (strain ATCC BAA-1733 / DSM 21960 / TBF 19.5.1) TaxID=521045 RepID=C5CFA7_KOSOT|nr:CRISPR-associated protein Cas2 [Kosmotoga olearia TBF 19.5.1]